ncbi:MAG: hypothetical protein LBE78_03810 [Burkholderiaceae bacterium]|jgi:hypothetical protein|nr:hypothetical protein [Burkholderiaceae bacterium]
MTNDERFEVLNAFRFRGWPTRRLLLPSGDKIICTVCWDGTEPKVEIYDDNHNVFRLNAQGEVIWQVRRDDSNHPPDWWGNLHAHAKARGHDGARYPFDEFVLIYPDGSHNIPQKTGEPPYEAIWTPGCTIRLRGSAYQQYILDPETGIAKNVTEGRPRPW